MVAWLVLEKTSDYGYSLVSKTVRRMEIWKDSS